MSAVTDRIEKTITLRAPLARVWQAISDAEAFGTWFGVDFDGPFVEGAVIQGRITPTKVDAEVAKLQEPYAGEAFDFTVERIEPMVHFSFRWHPFAIDRSVDYSSEPMTRVVFALAEVAGGTQLTIEETGFDRIPLERRATAFAANEGGWTHQAMLLEKFLARAA